MMLMMLMMLMWCLVAAVEALEALLDAPVLEPWFATRTLLVPIFQGGVYQNISLYFSHLLKNTSRAGIQINFILCVAAFDRLRRT